MILCIWQSQKNVLHCSVIINSLLIIFGAISFLVYGIACLRTPYMISEFERFGLSKYRITTGILEILGALGLLVGFVYKPIGLAAAGGLAILMFFGFCVRLKIKDGAVKASPAFLFMILNSYLLFIFYTC